MKGLSQGTLPASRIEASLPPPTTKPRRKLATIQDLRAIACLGIVVFHARACQQFNFDGKAVIGIWSNVAQVGPDIFFMISGFIMMNSTWRPLDGWRGFKQFFKRRFLRIYPTYWVVAIPVLVLWYWNPLWWNPYSVKESRHLWDVAFSSLSLLPLKYPPILIVAWTIIYEVYFYLLISFIFLLNTRGRLVACGVWFLVIVVINLVPHMHQKPLVRVITSPLCLEFITGIFLAAAFTLELPKLRSRVAIAGCAVATSLIVWAAMSHTEISYFFDHHRWRVFCFGPGVALIVALSLWMEKQGRWTVLGKLSAVGDRSYSLYLLHLPIYQSVFTAVAFFQPAPSSLVIALATLLAMAMMVPATELLYQKVEKPCGQMGSSRPRPSAAGITQPSSEAAVK